MSPHVINPLLKCLLGKLHLHGGGPRQLARQCPLQSGDGQSGLGQRRRLLHRTRQSQLPPCIAVRSTQFQFTVTMSEHVGTHIDAPFHFNPKGWTTDQVGRQRKRVYVFWVDPTGAPGGHPRCGGGYLRQGCRGPCS